MLGISKLSSTSAAHSRYAQRLAGEFLEPRYVLTDVFGTIAENAVWSAAESPFDVTGDITVARAATLTIEPGVELRLDNNVGITVRGRLVAEGTPFDRIMFDRAAGASRWDGLRFDNTLEDSRIAYADMLFGDGQGEAILVERSRLFLDNLTWTGTTGTILELSHPSLVVRNSHFPTSFGGEVIHGEQITGHEYLIIEGNVFANSNNGGDVIDFLGANRPGPVVQILNNVFLGGGDDGLDLDGTDAHIEGNVFRDFRKNTSRPTTSNAIATGLPQTGALNRTEITVVRNLFLNNDHAILLKEDAFAKVENNVFVGSQEAVFQFNEVGGTAVLGAGRGARLDGNIFWSNAELFKNLVDTAQFRTDLIVNRSLLPNDVVDFGGTSVSAQDLGAGNVAGDPMFVDAAGSDYRLQPGSPAIGKGPNGLDMGAYVSGGPLVSRIDSAAPEQQGISYSVAGPGISQYRYRLNGGPFGPLTPVGSPITLADLADGTYTIDIVGMNDAGEWFTGRTQAFGESHAQLISPARVRAGETLPMIVRVSDWSGQVDTLLSTPATLNGPLDDGNIRIKKGVGSASPVVMAVDDFQLNVDGSFNTSEQRTIDLLDASFPVADYAGRLAGDTVWDASIERRVTGDLLIPRGRTLSIEPGTRILLGDKVNVRVEGQIVARGTAEDPILFNSLDHTAPWGGVELFGTDGQFEYTFFTNAGADTTKAFGHSGSQPVIMADGSTLQCSSCFVLDSVGKGLGSRNDARVVLDHSVVSHVDTGGEFQSSIVQVSNTHVKDIPNDDGVFVDDDNDGFYFSGVHSSGEPSLFEESFIITAKDDGLDHNGARLRVVRGWIEDAAHEGVAASNSGWVTIDDSVILHNNQGVEAGYGSPEVTIRNSVIVDNDNRADPNTPTTAGVRFGDGYDGRLGPYLGHITAEGVVLHDNGDNVRSFDGSIPGQKPDAIDVSGSLTNDAGVDGESSNLTGVPHLGPRMHLLRGSAGVTDGSVVEEAIGRRLPLVSATFTVGATQGPTVEIAGVSSPRVTPMEELVVQFDQPVTGFDATDLLFTRNGDDIPLPNSAGLFTSDEMSYRITGLSSFTAASGRYAAGVNVTGSDIIGSTGAALSGGAEIAWTMGPGDANQDGQFGALDIVTLLQAAKFSTDQPAVWSEGDFNGDGRFDADDLVIALVTDSYGKGRFSQL